MFINQQYFKWQLVSNMKLFVLVATCVALAAAVHDVAINVDSFDGFKVYRAFPEEQDLDFMRQFESQVKLVKFG